VKAFVKLRFSDFRSTTAEGPAREIVPGLHDRLLADAWERRGGCRVRLIGAGVRFAPRAAGPEQLELAGFSG
jgi:hypothetical protein